MKSCSMSTFFVWIVAITLAYFCARSVLSSDRLRDCDDDSSAPAKSENFRRDGDETQRRVRFKAPRRLTQKEFRKNNDGYPTVVSGKKTAMYVKWTKCGHCRAFDPVWDAFIADRAKLEPGAEVLTLTYDAGDADADALVKWLGSTPVFDGSFPTVVGFPAKGAAGSVYRGPRDLQAIRAWFEKL